VYVSPGFGSRRQISGNQGTQDDCNNWQKTGLAFHLIFIQLSWPIAAAIFWSKPFSLFRI
jgi:hypothetical protein